MKSVRFLCGYLWCTLPLIALATVALLSSAVGQYREVGFAGWRSLAAASLGIAICCITPLAIRRLGRWQPASGRPFTRAPAYYRSVVILLFGLFLATLFGTNTDVVPSFAFHMFIALFLHRTVLCFPALVQAAVEQLYHHRALRILELSMANALVTVVVAELFLRVVALMPGDALGISNSPLSGKLTQAIFGFSPNSLGYNDREFVKEKSESKLRIAAVGDSFLVASVPRPYAVVARTEALLKEKNTTNEPEIYNFSIIGAGPTQYLDILRIDTLQFKPDVVLLNFYVGNDINDKKGQKVRDRSRLLNKRGYASYWVIRSLTHRARQAQVAQDAEFQDLTQIPKLDRDIWFSPGKIPPAMSRDSYLDTAGGHLLRCNPASSVRLEKQWDAALRNLRKIKAICDDEGIPLLIAISPDHFQVSPKLRDDIARRFRLDLNSFDFTLLQRRLIAFCKEQRIPYLDLLGAFITAAETHSPDDLYLANDTHWSAAGNEVAARAIASWLTEWLELR